MFIFVFCFFIFVFYFFVYFHFSLLFIVLFFIFIFCYFLFFLFLFCFFISSFIFIFLFLGGFMSHLPTFILRQFDERQLELPLMVTAYGAKVVCFSHPGDGPGAKQSFADDCDINHIMAKYVRTGVLEHTNERLAQFGDATGMDFAEAMATVRRAESMFEDLPASLRARFENKPGRFVEFLDDSRNDEEAIALGFKVAMLPIPTPSGNMASDAILPASPAGPAP